MAPVLASPPCPLQPALGLRPSVLSGPGWTLLSPGDPAPRGGQRGWMAPSGSQPMVLVVHVVFFPVNQGTFPSLPSPLHCPRVQVTLRLCQSWPLCPNAACITPSPHTWAGGSPQPLPLMQGWDIFDVFMDSKHSWWFLLPPRRAEHGPSPPAAAAALGVCPHSGPGGVWPRRWHR